MATKYTIPLGFFIIATPADATTYFAGIAGFSFAASSDTWAEGNFEIPVAGTITAVSYSFKNGGTLASGENVEAFIRHNDTTDIASSGAEPRFDVAFETLVVSGLSQACAVGDKIALKVVMPTFVTNPTGATLTAVVHLE